MKLNELTQEQKDLFTKSIDKTKDNLDCISSLKSHILGNLISIKTINKNTLTDMDDIISDINKVRDILDGVLIKLDNRIKDI